MLMLRSNISEITHLLKHHIRQSFPYATFVTLPPLNLERSSKPNPSAPNHEFNSTQPNFMEKRKEKQINEGLEIEGYKIQGISIGGRETCIMFPSLSLAFDIGRCPPGAVSQEFLLISHGHLDHIGGLPMYVSTRSSLSMKPPTIIVPKAIKEHVERLFDVHRAMDQSKLNHKLVGLDVGEEFCVRKDLKVKAFRTHHVIPSQGYVVYSLKQKLKEEYIGLPGYEIKKLKISGVEITNTSCSPEIAFTGDTTAEFIVDPSNVDALRAKILVMECTFVDDKATVAHAKGHGHTHLAEVVQYAKMFQNKAILLIHFSPRYKEDEIRDAVSRLPEAFAGRIFTLTKFDNWLLP